MSNHEAEEAIPSRTIEICNLRSRTNQASRTNDGRLCWGPAGDLRVCMRRPTIPKGQRRCINQCPTQQSRKCCTCPYLTSNAGRRYIQKSNPPHATPARFKAKLWVSLCLANCGQELAPSRNSRFPTWGLLLLAQLRSILQPATPKPHTLAQIDIPEATRLRMLLCRPAKAGRSRHCPCSKQLGLSGSWCWWWAKEYRCGEEMPCGQQSAP